MKAIDTNHYLMKLMLVLARDFRAMQGSVRSVRFIREYAPAPEHLGVHTLSLMGEAEIAALAESMGIKKTPSHAKSDVYMNDVGYSLQSFALHPPVLVNGVTRSGIAAVCERLDVMLDPFDIMIDKYWALRESGDIGEEVGSNDPISPFKDHKESILPVLSYFLFTGTVSGDSPFPADCVLDFTEPCNMNTWAVYEKEQALELLWERLLIRVAPLSGGDADESGGLIDNDLAWTRQIGGTQAGALYIRVT